MCDNPLVGIFGRNGFIPAAALPARYARGDSMPFPRRGPIPPCDINAYLQYSDLFQSYADPVRDAVAVLAHTVAGIHAKLALGVIVARRGNARIYMYEDSEWLQAALIDLERLANPKQRVGRLRPWTPDPLVLA
ncbi:hypothetical protein [Pelagibius litoralis]|uniref:hypothetical protein n=1 Tax=Pelagibius litoralis TaxID=374515 RepID=UPI001F0F47A5|nr:hypothetical protein [Pelagibius litoralis]